MLRQSLVRLAASPVAPSTRANLTGKNLIPRDPSWGPTKRTKKSSFREMLASRPVPSDFSRSPIRAACLVERLHIVQPGGRYGNPLLATPDGQMEHFTDDDDTYLRWQRVQEIKEGLGKVYPSELNISDHSVLPPTVDGLDRVAACHAMLPDVPEIKQAIASITESLEYPPTDVRRKMTSRLYLLVKPKGESSWQFPTGGIVEEPTEDSPTPDLRLVGERVIANLLNSGSAETATKWWTPTDEAREAEITAEALRKEKERANLTPKQLRAIRKGEKKVGGGADEKILDVDVVPFHLHTLGNTPMGVLYKEKSDACPKGERTFLFRSFVIDVDNLDADYDGGLWDRSMKRIEEKTGEWGWFSKREIVNGKLLTDDENETKYLEYLLEDIHEY